MMQRRHFEVIANILSIAYNDAKDASQKAYWARLTEIFCEELKKTNPNFNRQTFLNACLD
jgi:hypothetical protein